ncbi:hypothetical protein HFN87_27820 [Rhizobium laguerreae]|uniref:hypothetical protein n=1 Tax=Rhizobium laguerreae TaxID=1076926 RepID=UPI001C91C240|nr:hypothetical protein [Rhizobium laguerreae]MBY3417071.1 hypothetical protein [Rhizobium laguerreae]
MTKQTFVDLDRHFVQLDDRLGGDMDDWIYAGPGIGWEALAKERRAIVLAEAGAGKTQEIKAAVRKLRASGKAAFFLRLEELSDGVTQASFDGADTGSLRELDTWLSGTDYGWLMLDSVDEARLANSKNFERAIKHLSGKLGDAAQRANIIITSRASEWRPESDLRMVNNFLPLPEAEETASHSNADNLERIFDSVTEAVDGTEKRTGARVYSLLPLDEQRIRQLAAHFGVNDTNSFYYAVERADAVGFASRPKDLEDLAEYWLKKGSIGGRLELVENDIALKLKERDQDRAQARPLASDNARLGAKILAAASSLLRDQQFRVPETDSDLDGIDVGAILGMWTEVNCQTLLSRPIFDEAIYGRVRFHHRSVREYLAAEWIVELLEQGNSRRQVAQLFFKSQYGIELIVPAMRPLLPWIALKDERIRNKLARIAPEVLTEGGDPSAFPADFREALIRDICSRLNRERSGRLLDGAAVRRMATNDLGPAISELLSAYEDDEFVRITLLRMAWQGNMRECLEQAKAFALGTSYDGITRGAAIQVVAATAGTAELAQFRDKLLGSLGERDLVVFGECLRSLGAILDTKVAIDVAANLLGPDKYGFQSLKGRFVAFVNGLPLAKCRTVVDEILVKLREAPFKEGRNYKVSDKVYWLLPVAARACERLVEAKDAFALSPNALDVMSLIEKSTAYDRSSIKSDLGAMVPAWSDLNESLFWHQISAERAKGHVIKNWWQVSGLPSFWVFSSADFPSFVEQLRLRQGDDRFVALSLALKIMRADASDEGLISIREAIGDDATLTARLDELLDPNPTAEQLEFQRRRREHEEETERHEFAEAARLAQRKLEISKNLDWLGAASPNAITGAQLHMLEALSGLDADRNRLAHPNWQGLIPAYGKEVAQAFKDGAQRYWRHYVPQLRSEGVATMNSVPRQITLGLNGIEFEAQEEGWLDALSPEHAKLATRYALWEMNGFSDWLGSLAEKFPSEVVEVLLTEIEWEFAQQDSESYAISNLVWHGEQLRPMLGGRLLGLLSAQEPRSLGVLRGALKIISADDTISDAELAALAEHKINGAASSSHTALWVALWLTVQAPEAITFLDSHLLGLDERDAKNFTMAASSGFLSSDHDWVSKRTSFKTPQSLKRLFEIFCRHIKRTEDTKRVHLQSYSPEDRDHAQRERDMVLTMLGEIEGKEAFVALMELADTHLDQDIRPYIRRAALARAEADANLKPWSAADFHAFAKDLDRHPGSPRELFDLVCNRLLDFKQELEEGDDSIASIVHTVDAETVQRNFFGKLFRDKANGRYFAPNEEELADAKRPDLRIHATDIHGPVPIEFKIADNWSGSELFERLQNQLCNDYLRDARSSYGVFLMSNRAVKRKSWEHPITGVTLTFDELCIALQDFAGKYIAKRPDIDGIKVVGIDLTKRLQARRPDPTPRSMRMPLQKK